MKRSRSDGCAGRPKLTKTLQSATFREYYYLKEELASFCKENDLPSNGSKAELTERVAHFLETGKVLESECEKPKRRLVTDETLTTDSIIEKDFVCSTKHRAFFCEHIGKDFTFNVVFQKWLKANGGKTYSDAIEAYHKIIEEKKKTKSEIDKQFEYNTYIRDFFAANKGKSLKDAIKCWKYKKSKPGHHKYEDDDLQALK